MSRLPGDSNVFVGPAGGGGERAPGGRAEMCQLRSGDGRGDWPRPVRPKSPLAQLSSLPAAGDVETQLRQPRPRAGLLSAGKASR